MRRSRQRQFVRDLAGRARSGRLHLARASRALRSRWLLLAVAALPMLLAACQQVDDPQISYDPGELAFSGERALELETAFVESFPDRDSGQPNNERAAEWIGQHMSDLGWQCDIDAWQVVNDSRDLPLRNVMCRLPGESERTIVVVAHHDQSPETVQGADNDGSGMAIMLHLAEIFAAETPLPYSLLFVSSDGEEYGMLGTRRLVSVYDDLEQIVAAVSLDNLGKEFYDGLEMSPIGQFRGYGALWLQRLAQESARAAGDIWIPQIRSPLDQALNQAVPISFMDQGPLVAAGVPAFGFAGLVPAEFADLHWETYHSPGDTLDLQSADVLRQAGTATEALIRQLNTMDDFPAERGPYLYNAAGDSTIRGPALWLAFLLFGLIFLAAAVLTGRKSAGGLRVALKTGLPHFAGLWLPLTAAVFMLYLFVSMGLMDAYAVYPATPKDPDLVHPHWLAIFLWLVGLWELLQLGRRLAGVYMADRQAPLFSQSKSLAMLVAGLGALYVVALNPFSLLLMLPLLFWLFIGGRSGLGRVVDLLLFLAGGLLIYALLYVFGFQSLRIDFAVLWYLMMMLSIRMVSPISAAVIAAIVAAGLSMVVRPPVGRHRGEGQEAAAAEAAAAPAERAP